MSESILLNFLQHGLIDVHGDDTKFNKLSASASDFADVLRASPSKGVSAALLAFDQTAPANDPLILEVLEILKKRWQTYMNTFSGVPIALIRGILLDALVQAASDNDKVAIGFASAARNVLPFLELGSEGEIWKDVVAEIEALVDKRAESEWATPEVIRVDKLKFSKPTPISIASSSTKVKRDWLQDRVTAAGGPNLPNGQQSGANPNPYWPGNQPQPWLQQFGTKMTEAIADAIDTLAEKSQVNSVDLTQPLEQFAGEVSAYAATLFSSFSGATIGLQRRTHLLWWKEALFSPSARVSYRSLDEIVAASLMAFDLFQQLPVLSPASVQSFLAESVRQVQTSGISEKRTLQEFVEVACSHSGLVEFRKVAAEIVPPFEGRGYLLSLISHQRYSTAIANGLFKELVGVPATTSLSISEWATWIFCELQAARATCEDNGIKRKTREGSIKK